MPEHGVGELGHDVGVPGGDVGQLARIVVQVKEPRALEAVVGLRTLEEDEITAGA